MNKPAAAPPPFGQPSTTSALAQSARSLVPYKVATTRRRTWSPLPQKCLSYLLAHDGKQVAVAVRYDGRVAITAGVTLKSPLCQRETQLAVSTATADLGGCGTSLLSDHMFANGIAATNRRPRTRTEPSSFRIQAAFGVERCNAIIINPRLRRWRRRTPSNPRMDRRSPHINDGRAASSSQSNLDL